MCTAGRRHDDRHALQPLIHLSLQLFVRAQFFRAIIFQIGHLVQLGKIDRADSVADDLPLFTKRGQTAAFPLDVVVKSRFRLFERAI